MRVFRFRNGAGFQGVAASGDSDLIVERASKSLSERLARKRDQIGRVVGFAENPGFRRRRTLHEAPRTQTLSVCIDALQLSEIEAEAEAERRGVCKGALMGQIIEIVIDDNLFAAILDR